MNIIKIPTNIGGGSQNPKMIVIHAMAQYINIDDDASKWYKNVKGKNIPVGHYRAEDWLKIYGASAHNLIETNGDILSLRSTKKIAYHARKFNKDSIGIEVLVKGTWNYGSFLQEMKKDWVTEKQYSSLVSLVKESMEYWKIPIDKIVRHSDISPERKYDPGKGFKWEEFLNRVRQ
jgi:N-acetyl-anhydromuramyl-L-alanine amidase AmpD